MSDLAKIPVTVITGFLGEIQHRVQLFTVKRARFRRALYFNQLAAFGHHHVQVGVGFAIFRVVQVQHRHALVVLLLRHGKHVLKDHASHQV